MTNKQASRAEDAAASQTNPSQQPRTSKGEEDYSNDADFKSDSVADKSASASPMAGPTKQGADPTASAAAPGGAKVAVREGTNLRSSNKRSSQ